MRVKIAALCLLSSFFVLASPTARAYVNSVDSDGRKMTLFFYGAKEENGAACESRSLKTQMEIDAAEKSIGVAAGSSRGYAAVTAAATSSFLTRKT